MLEGAKQKGTSGVAYSRNQPSVLEKDQERHGRLVRRPPAAVNRSRHATFLPPTARTSASGTEDGYSPTPAMHGADDRCVHTRCQGDGHRPVVVRAAPPDERKGDTARARS